MDRLSASLENYVKETGTEMAFEFDRYNNLEKARAAHGPALVKPSSEAFMRAFLKATPQCEVDLSIYMYIYIYIYINTYI